MLDVVSFSRLIAQMDGIVLRQSAGRRGRCSYEVYATADFQDDVRLFEEKDCVAERALLEDGADTGGRLRWNEAGECVCYVNTEIHKEWKAQSTIRARRRQQTKEDAFIAVVGSKRPNRLEVDVFAPKDEERERQR
eukprot:COSAG05_NODE_5_length_47078_cov_547.868814_12_plen_136_part_00